MNVLYLSYDGMTDPLGQSQVLPYLAGISQAGHHINLVSFEKAVRYEKMKSEVEMFCFTNNIEWYPLTYTKWPPVLSTVWDVIKMHRKAYQLHRRKKIDVVHCRSYISALVGLSMKRKYGLKFIFDMRGFWADERVEGNLWKLTNPLYKAVYNFFKKKEKEFLSEADCIVSLTNNAANEIHGVKSIGHKPVRIEVIPCCADMNLFDPTSISETEKQSLRLKLGINKNDFVLSYIGSLGTWYMLDEMLDFFSVLLMRKPNSKFLVITNDPEIKLFNKAADRNIPSEKIIVTHAQRKQMPLYISLSNATLFFIKPSFSKKASSPVKQGEAMGMGVPIICNALVGDTDEIVTGSNSGIVLNSFSTDEYKLAVDRLLSTNFSDDHIRAEAIRRLSLDSGVKKYLSLYKELEDK